jgi:hypothetical protein
MAVRISGSEELPAMARRYPWKEWADGDVWLILRGEDYLVSDDSFRVSARMYATRHGMFLRSRKDPQGMVIQFLRKDPPAKKKMRRLARDKG